MALCLAGMTTRKELLGVTSIVRALGLEPACYDRLLDLFHSPALAGVYKIGRRRGGKSRQSKGVATARLYVLTGLAQREGGA
jgi:hypothetical protein